METWVSQVWCKRSGLRTNPAGWWVVQFVGSPQSQLLLWTATTEGCHSVSLGGQLDQFGGFLRFDFWESGLPALGLPGIPSAPQLGVAGAAWGTVVGSIVEATIPMIALFMAKTRANFDVMAARGWHLSACRELFHRGWPASLSWGSELICWAWFMTALVGRFGSEHMTASWIAMRYMHLSFMPAVGFSVAITSIVGRLIGEGSPEEAQSRVESPSKLASCT